MIKYVLIALSPIIAIVGIYYGLQKYHDYQVDRDYQKSIAPIQEAYKKAVEYDKKLREAEKKEQAMLKADTYGGKTPEETLALFVDALKKKDADLASKYYMPWLQEQARKDMWDYVDNHEESVIDFLNAVRKNIIKRKERVSGVALKIYINSDDKYPYSIEMKENKINHIWKITDF